LIFSTAKRIMNRSFHALGCHFNSELSSLLGAIVIFEDGLIAQSKSCIAERGVQKQIGGVACGTLLRGENASKRDVLGLADL
jgi:hypothetical protein